MIDSIFNFFLFGGKDFALFIISMVPFIELRGAVIFGAALGMPWLHVFLISLLGNILPVPFLILLGRPVFTWLKSTRLLANFTHKVEAKLMSKSEKIEKYSAIGLFLFVGVPLPGTGAWSGSLIAALLGLKPRHSIPAVMAGVLLADILMTLGAYGVFGALRLF
ncbi:COG2426 family protein [Acidaminobacterium chupaoyuni]